MNKRSDINFNSFKDCVKEVIKFRVEWDDEQWNQQYINFKYWLEGVCPKWKDERTARALYFDFSEDYYCDAHPDTHDYWHISNDEVPPKS